MDETLVKRRGGPLAANVGAMGIGTWAIGGPFFSGERCRYPTGAALGYGEVDDATSIRAIHCALDFGARLFDTSDAYGTGHAERILGEALKGRRDDVTIATKFGNTYDENSRTLTGVDVSPTYIRKACLASLRRLQTNRIDLYQLHVGDLMPDLADAVADTLDELCDEGLIGAFAWSTDDPARAALFARREKGAAVQFDMNVFQDAQEMLTVCETHDMAGIIRSPLAMGFLSGKFTSESRLPSDDIRANPPPWLPFFRDGGQPDPDWSKRLAGITDILTTNGRSQAQGALAWIWARSERAIPIPGIRTEAQARENLGAVEFGPLDPGQMAEIDRLLNRSTLS